MAVSSSDSSDTPVSPRMAISALRATFVAVGIVALILGYLGLDQYLAQEPAASRDFLNLLYGDLQLFVLGSDPLQNATRFPLALQIARFAAPAVTLFAVTEAVRLLMATELRRIRARRARGHAIVCGDSSAARTLAARLHAGQQRVVVVRSRPIGALELRRRSLLGVSGDATDADVLRGAGAAQATVIYACADDSATNVAIATAAGRILGDSGGSATVYALIHDPERAVALQARRLGVDAAPGLRLDFFNFDQLAVRVLLAQRPLPVAGGRPPRLLVAGDSPFARALLVEIARDWRLRRTAGQAMASIDFVAPAATRTLYDLSHRYVILRESCEVTPYDTDVAGLLARRRDATYDEAYLCYDDEEYGLQVALTSYELWHRVSGSVLVPVDRLAGLTDAFGDQYRQPLLDQVRGRIRLFGKVSAACDPALIAEDLVERLARLIHERYVIGVRDRNEPVADPAALVDWTILDDERRRANRSQATSIGAKLHAIGCAIVARSGHDDFEMSHDEVELLARAEQQRWVNDAAALGWRPGAVPNGITRQSPDLVDWAELGDAGKEKCRAAVRDIPPILADAGFQVVRIGDTSREKAANLV
jgi:voltage-gated potassium channel Kch